MGATDLRGVKAALATMTDAELYAVSETTCKVSQVAPGLLAWVEYACIWQVLHRAGHDDELRPPEALIPPEEQPFCSEVAIALRERFADRPALRALFDALVDLLPCGGQKH